MTIALKIHVSEATKIALDHFQTFILQLRGKVAMKVGIFFVSFR